MSQTAEPASATPSLLAAPPSLAQVFVIFSRIGLTSVGGGLSAWMLREFVQQRRWLTEEAFLNGFAVCQALPGVNVVNLAIWIGYQLRGGRGALLAALGIVVPPMIVALLALMVFEQASRYPWVQVMFAGIAAAALGMASNLAVRTLRRFARTPVPALFAVASFSLIFFARLPLWMVVFGLGPASVAWAWYRLRAGKRP